MKTLHKSFLILLFFILIMNLVIVSCGAKNGKQKDPTDESSISVTEKTIIIPEKVTRNGKQVYLNYCSACHQADGSGNPGLYPPVAETKKVNGDIEELVNIVLHGLSGPVEVKGEIYNQFMAPHNFLSDEQVADLLSYVRSSFGNSSSIITKEQVKKIRAKGINHKAL